MKKLLTMSFIGMMSTWGFNSVIADDTTKVEIPVEAALAPTAGYDNNDNVEVVIHGSLPNSCYRIADHEVIKDETTGKFKFKQFAHKRLDGVCAQGAVLPPHMQMQIPFTRTLAIGQLPKGEYELTFSTWGGNTKTRPMLIEEAPALTVDSKPYAIVTGVDSQDLFGANDTVTFKVRGMLNSTCTHLDEKVEIVNQKDVLVVLPTVHVDKDAFCAEVLVPFERSFEVEKRSLGHHLIHVRSLGGQSMNRIFEVLPL